MSLGRRLIAAAVAFVLMAVMVMPTMADACQAAAPAVAHAVPSFADHDHAADRHAEDDLAHHAQSHAQGVMPAFATATMAAVWIAMAFAAVDEPVTADGGDGELFEPPRA